MENKTLASSNSLSAIILRILRIGIAADIIFYATYDLGAVLKVISDDIKPYGVECPWYVNSLIQFSDIVVIYTAQCFVIAVVLTGLYLYAELKLAPHSRAVWVILSVIELLLLITAIALLLAWGAGLQSLLVQYILLRDIES
ncbi:hypothetical protein N9153_01685 [Planctomicrobium sp.]|jgi:hypothetical protein|nr:hypothetical protein [Planctomicrobium sp.]